MNIDAKHATLLAIIAIDPINSKHVISELKGDIKEIAQCILNPRHKCKKANKLAAKYIKKWAKNNIDSCTKSGKLSS